MVSNLHAWLDTLGGEPRDVALNIAERERLYAVPKRVHRDDLTWEGAAGSKRRRLQATVYGPGGETLTLRGVVAGTRYSFALHFRGIELVRRWDFCPHTRPDGVHLQGGHKHPCEDQSGEEWAYVVDDIPTDDAGEALMRFLAECEIKLVDDQQIHVPGT